MTTYIDMLPDSRVWVYQCSRKLSEMEKLSLEQKATEFVNTWSAHDFQLKTYFELRYELFFILMVDVVAKAVFFRPKQSSRILGDCFAATNAARNDR